MPVGALASYDIAWYGLGGVRIISDYYLAHLHNGIPSPIRVRNDLHRWALVLTRTHAVILSELGFRNSSEGVSMIKSRHAVRGSELQTRQRDNVMWLSPAAT